MAERTICIARDYSRYPGGRYKHHGDFSGEEFREKFLEPVVLKNDVATVDLNNLFTIPPSFLDEAFGVIIARKGDVWFHEHFTLDLKDDPAAIRELDDIYEKRQREFVTKVRV